MKAKVSRRTEVKEAMRMLSEQRDKVRNLRYQADVVLPREEERLKEFEAQTASILNPRKFPTQEDYKEHIERLQVPGVNGMEDTE